MEQDQSRQERWQAKQRQKRRCPTCGGKKPCLRCLATQAAYMRNRYGFRPWRPGSRGRTPIWYLLQQKAQRNAPSPR